MIGGGLGITWTTSVGWRWRRGAGATRDYLGWLALKKGDLERAETYLRTSVRLAEEDGDQILLAWTLTDLGFILHEKNAGADTRKIFLHALQVALKSQNRPAALY